MADIIYQGGNPNPARAVDMGDGSWAEVLLDRNYVDKSSVADNVATDTTGVKLSYTVPAGKTARVHGVSWFNNAGTPTVQLQLVRSAATIIIRSDTAAYAALLGLRLQAGDVLQFNVTVAAAASSTADASISVEETR